MPRDELCYCMRQWGLGDKHVSWCRTCVRTETVMRYEVGVTDGFTVGVGLHQGSALSPLLFAVEVDMLKDEVRLESSWTMMFSQMTL